MTRKSRKKISDFCIAEHREREDGTTAVSLTYESESASFFVEKIFTDARRALLYYSKLNTKQEQHYLSLLHS